MKKKYQSKIDYSKKYNSTLSTIQIDREIHKNLKDYCVKENISIREFLTHTIKEKLYILSNENNSKT